MHIQHEIAKRTAVNPEDAANFRIGLNAGEPIGSVNDLLCASARVARQICELAKPDQIVVSEIVRQLVAGKDFAFEPLGAKMLKGLDEPVAFYKLGVA